MDWEFFEYIAKENIYSREKEGKWMEKSVLNN